MAMPTDFNRWVNDNNPDERLEYRKGWWDYIEIIRRLAGKFDIKSHDIQVVSTYQMKTPPPCEELLMPVLRLQTPEVQLTIKYDFGVFVSTGVGGADVRTGDGWRG